MKTIERQGNFIRFQITVAGRKIWFLTHAALHVEEIAAISLLELYGTKEFLKTHCPHGIIHVGVLGGEFDEHPANGEAKKEDECAATLVARALGVRDNEELKEVLSYVLDNDLHGRDQPGGLATYVNMLHRVFSEQTAEIIDWALVAIRAKIRAEKKTKEFGKDYFGKLLVEQNPNKPEISAANWLAYTADAEKAQDEAFKAALEEIKEKGQISKIKGPNERTLVLLAIESDNNEIGRAGRFKDGANADIVVQRRPAGHVTIHTARRANLKLFTLARVLRYEEQKVRGKVIVNNWRELSDEGMGPSGVWYFHHEGQFLLNGSITAPATTPTMIPLADICELIKVAVCPETFEPARAALCQMGMCASKPENACPWYVWGLPWCQAVRAKAKEKR